MIERAVIFAEGDVIEACDVGLIGVNMSSVNRKTEDLQISLRIYEKERIYRILNKYNGDKAQTAKALGIGLSSLYRKIDELEINVKKYKKEQVIE